MNRIPSVEARQTVLFREQFLELDIEEGMAISPTSSGNIRKNTRDDDSECLKNIDCMSLLPRLRVEERPDSRGDFMIPSTNVRGATEFPSAHCS